MSASPFSLLEDGSSYAAAVDTFLADTARTRVPVWTDGRVDLAASAACAASVYGKARRPVACSYGVMLGPEALPAGLIALIDPLADRWLDKGEVGSDLLDTLFPRASRSEHGDREAGEGAGPGEVHSLLIAGLYEHLTVDTVWPLLRAADHRPDVRLRILTGRDAASLAWFTAKQYVRKASDVRELGVFTAVDRGLSRSGIRLLDARDMETADVRSEILGTRWSRLLLQGHGKDDSLNLADYTICGLNSLAPRRENVIGPICAYSDEPTCYRPLDKLIQLREIRAAEVVLSSCNNGPFTDAAIYDPKYQLMLNAIDGTARDVVAAITAHDVGRAENASWMETVLAHGSSAAAFNSSIRTAGPSPAYVHFGMGDDEEADRPEPPSLMPEPLLLTTSARATAYLAGGLLRLDNPLRNELENLATRVDSQVARESQAVHDRAAKTRDLVDDLESLDLAIAERFVGDPENEFSGCFGYFGDRSSIDSSSLASVRCQCGRPAERFVRRALVPTALDTEGVICTRCSDVSFRLPTGPSLRIHAEEDLLQGSDQQVRVEVHDARPGIVHLSLFVAKYGREYCTVAPQLRRVDIGPQGHGETEFTLTVARYAAPMAYYLTAYAVQDLAIAMARHPYGVFPASDGSA
ncbi:hypothetical protein HCJ92_03155 [Streptomyces sp. ventii]|uniref:CHAT domain-containing protein n=2 Tax=Streptomyces spiramenti TaxID=2720606 RepID=A0ABX1AGI8_9ACTN|nr:hypothetical protein [Streptomyces spiramenti]NJP65305.1 hypothetical protein [Streptomyces spiramenti]